MKELIDKADAVEAIEKLKRQLLRGACSSQISMETNCKEEAYDEVLSFLNTLEVKEVDLEKEVDDYVNEYFSECDDGVLISDANSMELTLLDITPLAKHFFELGIKAQKGE